MNLPSTFRLHLLAALIISGSFGITGCDKSHRGKMSRMLALSTRVASTSTPYAPTVCRLAVGNSPSMVIIFPARSESCLKDWAILSVKMSKSWTPAPSSVSRPPGYLGKSVFVSSGRITVTRTLRKPSSMRPSNIRTMTSKTWQFRWMTQTYHWQRNRMSSRP